MSIGPICLTCGRIHFKAEVRAIGRFVASRPTTFQSRYGGPVRETHAEAQLEVCPGWKT